MGRNEEHTGEGVGRDTWPPVRADQATSAPRSVNRGSDGTVSGRRRRAGQRREWNRDRETRREHDRDSVVHWIFFLGSMLGVQNEGLLLRTGRPFTYSTFTMFYSLQYIVDLI